ncbi:MAG: hypothetical protein ACE5EE_11580 [Fidelibacterota bacterium]
MKASQMVHYLQKLINKHGDLPVYTNHDDNYPDYAGESESSGIRFAEEIDDRMIDEESYVPKRFYIKT